MVDADDDVILGDNGSILRRGDTVSPRARILSGPAIYDANGDAQVTETAQILPTGAASRDIVPFDHSDSPAPNTFGNDYIAGGADDDTIFGQLGNDSIQGDGAVSITVTPAGGSVGLASDGDDYIEGNGGDDLILGNLGQDDLIGGSSDLFGLAAPTDRPDGSDIIYGGAGIDLARNTAGDTSATGHARDADVILADNGRILRLVRIISPTSTAFLTFNYDNYGAARIIPRATMLLDYTSGGAATDRGAADLAHGEAGDDIIHGMTGNDVLFGEGQDDDIYGGTGHDRIYGGSGEDGVLGDDGRIYTSRNGQTEPLNRLDAPNAQVEIGLNGPWTGAVVFITGRLTKSPRSPCLLRRWQ